MGEAADRYEKIMRADNKTERIQFFSDAVFAIAMTLLVIDITVPSLSSPSDKQLTDAVFELWPRFMAYAISFAVIGINWLGHHRKFTVTRDYDGGLLWLNLGLLFFIALLPFPTSLMSEYPGRTASVTLYALVVSTISLMQYWMWSYAYRKGYLDERIDLPIYRFVRRDLLVVPLVFLLSIPIAFIPGGGFIAMFFWGLNWPLSTLAAGMDKKSAGDVKELRTRRRQKVR